MGKCKEENKIEKIIRGLLKLPENRRCINCNSLGPQYVCTTFMTFICTNCSGVHREFTHRVKSVSMAKISMEEASALQAGGNEKARQIYFKTWDPKFNILPENSNINKLRNFIKHVYVYRQYTGETHPASLRRSRNSGMYEPYEHRRSDSSENSAFHEKIIERYSRHSNNEVRSPRHSSDNSRYVQASSSRSEEEVRESSRYGGHKSSSSCSEGNSDRYQVEDPRENSKYGDPRAGSSCFEAKDGRYRVDDTRISGRTATQMFTTEDIKPRRRSPDRQQSSDMKVPTLRYVKEILGENSHALRVASQPKFADWRCVRATANAQQEHNHHKDSQRGGDYSGTAHRRSVSASSQNSAESGSQLTFSNAELKPKSGSAGAVSTDALADFPSPSDGSVQNPSPQAHITLKSPVKKHACHAHPKNTLESLLFEFSTRAKMASSDQSCDKNSVSSPSSSSLPTRLHKLAPFTSAAQAITDERTSSSASAAATTSNTLTTGMPARSTDADTPKVATPQIVPDLLGDDVLATGEVSRKHSQSTLGHSNSLVSDSCSTAIQTRHLNECVNNKTTTFSPASSAAVTFSNSAAQPSQFAPGPPRETQSFIGMQPSLADTKAVGRKELPADLFASPYQFSSMTASGWPTGSNYGMGFNMHYYPPQMQISPFQNVAKSSNPFDTNDNTAQPHINMFASKGFLQGGASHKFTPSGISHMTSFGSPFPGAYMGQHSFHNKSPTSIQGTSGFSGEVGSTVLLHSNQQIPYRYPAPTDQSSFHTGGGNPFG